MNTEFIELTQRVLENLNKRYNDRVFMRFFYDGSGSLGYYDYHLDNIELDKEFVRVITWNNSIEMVKKFQAIDTLSSIIELAEFLSNE